MEKKRRKRERKLKRKKKKIGSCDRKRTSMKTMELGTMGEHVDMMTSVSEIKKICVSLKNYFRILLHLIYLSVEI